MGKQLSILDPEAIIVQPKFSGEGYDAKLDEDRLSGQIKRVFDLMKDGTWRTLSEIEVALIRKHPDNHDGQASISAQLRNLRKEPHGSHTVTRRRRGEGKKGVHEYQLIVNTSKK